MSTPSPAHFVLVGGAGWRAQFFLSAARELPHLFRCTGMLIRNPEQARAVHATWGVPVYQTLDALLDHGQPTFAVVSVPRTAAPDILAAIARAEVPILCETPPAGTLDELLKLHALVKQGARIQVAEQFTFQPAHAARLAIIRSGLIGDPTYAHLSASHGYHNISLLRHYLGIGYEPVTIRAQKFTQKIIKGPHRAGPPQKEELIDCPHVLATFDFGSKQALYDAAENQHRSLIRTNHTLIRGPRGEINDNTVKYLPPTEDGYLNPITTHLIRHDAGQDETLEGYHHKGITAGDKWFYKNPFPLSFASPRLLDDELAVATCMLKMAEYAKGGTDFYPLAEASQDTYLSMLLDESAATGKPMTSTPQPWCPSQGK
jgi:predicted dehydrogenase